MMVSSYSRGHLIIYENKQWIYEDNHEPIGSRSCKRCKKPPTPEGYDACLGFISGVTSACCGHGVESSYNN